MAHVNTYLPGGRFITVTLDGADPNDWDGTDLFPNGTQIVSIEMVPAVGGDAVTVRDASASGPRVFSHQSIDLYDIAVRYYGGHSKGGYRGTQCSPYIAAADITGSPDVTFEIA